MTELSVDVAVDSFGGIAVFFEGFFHLLGEHHGPMAPARAADGNGEVALSFAYVVWNQVGEQAFNALEKFGGLRERAYVLANFGIEPRVFPQLGHKMRIRQKAYVENEVGITGHAIAIAEADNGNEHRALLGILEALGDELAQFVDVEL